MDKAKTENQLRKLQSLHLISDAKEIFGSLTPFNCAGCSTLLSPGLVLLPASSSPWQAFTALASPTSWGLQHNPGFTFTSS